MDQNTEGAIEQRLEQWLVAAKMAYKIGTIGTRPTTAEMLLLHARLPDTTPKLPAGQEHTLDTLHATSMRQEFFAEFMAECRMAQLIDKRFRSEAFDWDLDDRVVMYVGLEVDNPGEAVMLMTYCYLNKISTLESLLTLVVPNGMPAKHAISVLWDLQKTSSGSNAVDALNAVNNVYKKRHAEEQ